MPMMYHRMFVSSSPNPIIGDPVDQNVTMVFYREAITWDGLIIALIKIQNWNHLFKRKKSIARAKYKLEEYSALDLDIT